MVLKRTSMRCCVSVLILCLILVSLTLSQDRASDSSQEGAVVEKISARVHFENDGTSTQEIEAAIRVQSEAGVQGYGQLVFGYSSATEKLAIDYVRVRKPAGEVVETPESNSQDFAPEMLQSAPMYSDFRQSAMCSNITRVRKPSSPWRSDNFGSNTPSPKAFR